MVLESSISCWWNPQKDGQCMIRFLSLAGFSRKAGLGAHWAGLYHVPHPDNLAAWEEL